MNETAARSLIADHLGVTRALIIDGVALKDLGADSLDLLGLAIKLEQKFQVKISDEQALNCRTVGDALRFLKPDSVVQDLPRGFREAPSWI